MCLELCWCYLQDGKFARGIRLAQSIQESLPQDRDAEFKGLMAKLYVEPFRQAHVGHVVGVVLLLQLPVQFHGPLSQPVIFLLRDLWQSSMWSRVIMRTL